MRDPVIYLCGPIAGCTDSECIDWREEVKRRWPGVCRDPMARDAREMQMTDELASRIVRLDLQDIDNSHGLLVYYDRPSVGTSMEIFYAAHERRIPVVLVEAPGAKASSPWLRHHTHAIVPNGSLTDGMAKLLHLITELHAR